MPNHLTLEHNRELAIEGICDGCGDLAKDGHGRRPVDALTRGL